MAGDQRCGSRKVVDMAASIKNMSVGFLTDSICCFLVLIVSPNLSYAQTLKCVDANGKVTYTNQVCPDSSKKKAEVRVTDNTADFSDYRRQAEQVRAPPPREVATSNLGAAGVGVGHRCELAKKNLATAQSGIRPSRASIEAAQQEVAIRCGQAPAGVSAGPCSSSMIAGSEPFLGNQGEIVKLLDGSIWQVNNYDYLYLYAYSAEVTICPAKGFLVIGKKKINVVPL